MPRGRFLPALCLLAAACAPADPETRGSASGGLVFAVQRDGQLDLARARIADGAVRPLTRTPTQDERWPYWSATAARLVFQRGPAGTPAQSDLWLWGPGAGETRAAHQETLAFLVRNQHYIDMVINLGTCILQAGTRIATYPSENALITQPICASFKPSAG